MSRILQIEPRQIPALPGNQNAQFQRVQRHNTEVTQQFVLQNLIQELTNAARRHNWPNLAYALDLAIACHDGQPRKAGGPFVLHPIRVALNLYAHGVRSESTIMASLLHDTLEDCPDRINMRDIANSPHLGPDVAKTVCLLTKRHEQELDAYYDGMLRHEEAALIKVADRLDNVATMEGAFTPEKTRDYIRETEQFVLPLAMTGAFRFPKRQRIIQTFAENIQRIIGQTRNRLTVQNPGLFPLGMTVG
ncbi:MAG TPA: HD domain-containing protein [Candidatus Latescibacteria bacterium]|nr:HD domain-containing protein [Candidatus Latescibacterota bacterium]